jgi:3-methylfumaryl-CoA hydratase
VSRTEALSAEPADALAALLDLEAAPEDELPALWHWVYLVDHPRQRELGADGHPRGGIPAPPEPGRARMFAGGRVATSALLRFGRPTTRTTRVVETTEKTGRSGSLVFTTVRSEWEQDGRTAIVEEQDIVYRAAGVALPARSPEPSGDGSPVAVEELEFDVDPVVLFRFSALTFNAHRIHYDLPYATSEGYPDLVVHGPLQALLLGEFLRRRGVPLLGSTFAYRLVAPAFGAQRLHISSPDEGRTVSVRDSSGRTTATANLEPLAVDEQPVRR